MAAKDGLSARQHKALAALLAEPTVARAATRSGVPERTLFRWLRDVRFNAAVRAARREAFNVAIAASQQATPAAVGTLARVMADPSSPHSAKIAAAAHLLRFARESIELDELAARIEAIEAAVATAGNGAKWQPPRDLPQRQDNQDS